MANPFSFLFKKKVSVEPGAIENPSAIDSLAIDELLRLDPLGYDFSTRDTKKINVDPDNGGVFTHEEIGEFKGKGKSLAYQAKNHFKDETYRLQKFARVVQNVSTRTSLDTYKSILNFTQDKGKAEEFYGKLYNSYQEAAESSSQPVKNPLLPFNDLRDALVKENIATAERRLLDEKRQTGDLGGRLGKKVMAKAAKYELLRNVLFKETGAHPTKGHDPFEWTYKNKYKIGGVSPAKIASALVAGGSVVALVLPPLHMITLPVQYSIHGGIIATNIIANAAIVSEHTKKFMRVTNTELTDAYAIYQKAEKSNNEEAKGKANDAIINILQNTTKFFKEKHTEGEKPNSLDYAEFAFNMTIPAIGKGIALYGKQRRHDKNVKKYAEPKRESATEINEANQMLGMDAIPRHLKVKKWHGDNGKVELDDVTKNDLKELLKAAKTTKDASKDAVQKVKEVLDSWKEGDEPKAREYKLLGVSSNQKKGENEYIWVHPDAFEKIPEEVKNLFSKSDLDSKEQQQQWLKEHPAAWVKYRMKDDKIVKIDYGSEVADTIIPIINEKEKQFEITSIGLEQPGEAKLLASSQKSMLGTQVGSVKYRKYVLDEDKMDQKSKAVGHAAGEIDKETWEFKKEKVTPAYDAKLMNRIQTLEQHAR